MIYHHTHLVTFSTVSNHSFDLSYKPGDSFQDENNRQSGFPLKQNRITWGEENVNADEAMNDYGVLSYDNSIDYEEGKWIGLQREGCSMEFKGIKQSSDQSQEGETQLQSKKRAKRRIQIGIKKPFDASQFEICAKREEIIDHYENGYAGMSMSGFYNGNIDERDIDYYQEQFTAYLEKNGLNVMKGLNKEERAKRMEIAKLAFLEFSRLKQEEINRLVEEELERRIRLRTADGQISQEEEQKIWEDMSQQYNVLIPQAPPFIDIPRLFDLHRKEQQRNYRISKGSTIEVIDDPLKSGYHGLMNSHSSYSEGYSQSDINHPNEMGEKGRRRHHRPKGKDKENVDPLDYKTIHIEKLKKLNRSEIRSTHTEIKKQRRRMNDEGDLNLRHFHTFTQKNSDYCPYCRKERTDSMSFKDKSLAQEEIKNDEANEGENKENDKLTLLKNELEGNDQEENEDNDMDLDSNEESENDDEDEDHGDNDNIYDSNEDEDKPHESDKDSETKRKEARAKAREKRKEQEKIKAKKKSDKPSIFQSKKKVEASKPEAKSQAKKPPAKPKDKVASINYPQFNNKKKEVSNNTNLNNTNHSKIKKVIQSLHKQVNANGTVEDRMKLSPPLSQNQSISPNFKPALDKGKAQSKAGLVKSKADTIHKKPTNELQGNRASSQGIHQRNIPQQAVKPIQKKLNITNHESSSINSKPSSSLNYNDSNTNLALKTNRTQGDWKKMGKPQLSAASTIAPISGTNFYNTKKIDYITNKDLNFGFEGWKENIKSPHFSTKNSRCNSGQPSNVIEEEKRLKPIKKKTFSNLTDEELERKKKQISDMMKDKSNPYSIYWADKFLNNACQMGITSFKSINGVPIITVYKKREESVDETFKQIQQELHKQKQMEMSKFHNKSSLSFHPCLSKDSIDQDQSKGDKFKKIHYPQILKYFN